MEISRNDSAALVQVSSSSTRARGSAARPPRPRPRRRAPAPFRPPRYVVGRGHGSQLADLDKFVAQALRQVDPLGNIEGGPAIDINEMVGYAVWSEEGARCAPPLEIRILNLALMRCSDEVLSLAAGRQLERAHAAGGDAVSLHLARQMHEGGAIIQGIQHDGLRASRGFPIYERARCGGMTAPPSSRRVAAQQGTAFMSARRRRG